MTSFQLFSEATLYFLLALLFARYLPFTYALYCSLSRSSRPILPILASFLTFLRDFLYSLYAVDSLLSLVALSLYIQPIFTQNSLSTNLNYNSFLRLTKFKLCRYCCLTSCLEIARYWELLFNYILTSLISRSKTRVANYLLTLLHIYKPTWSPRAMPNRVSAVRYSSSTLEYAHFIVIWRCLLTHTNVQVKLAIAPAH